MEAAKLCGGMSTVRMRPEEATGERVVLGLRKGALSGMSDFRL